MQFAPGALALVLIGSGPGLLAQQWEIGGAAGFGLPREAGVSGPSIAGNAGFSNGVAFGAVAGNNMYGRLGGEARYTYRASDLKLTAAGQSVGLNGEAHAIHYDLLLHAAPAKAIVRPFLAGGAGVKLFRGTGTERSFQPLSEIAVLSRTSEAKPLVSVGGGVKIALSDHALVRFDLRDYASPFPEKLIAPRRGVNLNGWLHDFVFLVGISLTVK